MAFGFRRIYCSAILMFLFVLTEFSCWEVKRAEPSVVPGPIRRFGCPFLNLDTYLVDQQTMMNVYGDEITSLDVPQEIMNQLIHSVTQSIESVLENNLLNTLNAFVDLHQIFSPYSRRRNLRFYEHFYSNANVLYQRESSDYSQVINVFNGIIGSDENLANRMYLVPVIVGVDDDTLNQYRTFGYIRQTLFEHVAGVIPFKLNGHEGYAVIDPGFSIPKPVVVFEDGSISQQFPNTAPTGHFYPERTTVEMRFLQFSATKLIVAEVKNRHGEIIQRNVYSVGLPYCSFMEHTAKPTSLKTTDLVIVRRDRHGNPRAKVSIDILPQLQNPTFEINIYDEPLDSGEISFADLSTDVLTQSKTRLLERADGIIRLPNYMSLRIFLNTVRTVSYPMFLSPVTRMYEIITGRTLSISTE